MKTSPQVILDLALKRGIIWPRHLEPLVLTRVTLTRLVRRGALTRTGRGLYALQDGPVLENAALAELRADIPERSLARSLRCVSISAHQSPFEVWLAIPNKFVRAKIGWIAP